MTRHDIAAVAHARQSATFVAPEREAEVAILQGTAGSTGMPRTASIAPDAVPANLRGLAARVGATPADITCSWLPLYHDMGLTFVMASALAGVAAWQAPTSTFAASFGWLHWLTESHATLTAAPNMANNLIGRYSRRVTDVDLSLERCASHSMAANPSTAKAHNGLRPRWRALASTRTPWHRPMAWPNPHVRSRFPVPGAGLRIDETRVVTDAGESIRQQAILGEAIPGMQVRVDPTDGRTGGIVGRDVGEIEIRGSSMMSGYLGHEPIEADEWFPTGDLGYFTYGGLVVCGRAKEVITMAGRNVFPTEIERVAAKVRGVREGAVVAVGTNERAVRPGLVIAAEFRGPDEPGARSELVQRVASQCGVIPTDVVFLAPGALPRTSSGKLRRLEVKRTLEAVGQ